MFTTTRFPGLARSFLAAIALGGGGLVVGTILVFIMQSAVASVDVELAPLALVVTSLILLQGIAFGGVTLVYTRYRGLDRLYFNILMPSLHDLVAVVLGYVTALIAMLVGAFLAPTFGVQAESNQVTKIVVQDPEVLLFLVPAPSLLIGPGEKLLFRGVVQNRIRESFGPVPGIVLTNAIFAMVYYVALTGGADGRLVTIGILFLPSVVFDTAYELTDNITAPALIHGTYNATLFSLAYLVSKLTGMSPGGVPTGLLF